MRNLTITIPFVAKGSKSFKQINLAFFIAGFTIFTVLYCVQPLMPYFVEHFKISETKASIALSISTFTLAISLLFFGAISEVLGRKKIMVFSVIGTSLLACILPFISTFNLFIIIRGFLGFFLAGLPAIAMAYLGEEITQEDIGSAIGLYISGNALGATFGRVFTGYIASMSGYETALQAVAAISLVASILFTILLPSSQHFQAKPLQLRYLTAMYIQHLKDFTLLRYFLLGFLLLGSNIALFNYIGFLLKTKEYQLSDNLISCIYLLFLLGMISSTYVSKMEKSLGRSITFRLTILLLIFGSILTLLPLLAAKVIGLACSVFAFFSGHSLASSQVSKTALLNKAQASSLYLLFYYLGSSVGGTVAGIGWQHYGWKGVVSIVIISMISAFLLIGNNNKKVSIL
ncbi:MFS transporter [Lysinibacillus capsici]|uniref:MFS transporter n=1 Tax=Lysinibacillus capsici TaxID=2115968 RepID=UPI0029DE7ADA|nr:MFS transporter [Lysinibacillus capsici]WPK07499.1 MFS transporter [Lysinibacillus capsici]